MTFVDDDGRSEFYTKWKPIIENKNIPVTCIRGTGLTGDYSPNQYTIILFGPSNNYNLISLNNCMGKAVTDEGGTGNSIYGNKWDEGNDLPLGEE